MLQNKGLPFLLLALVFYTSLGHGLTPWQKLPQSRARLIADQAAVQPGSKLKVGLHIQLDSGWHTYNENPGDSGAPPTFNISLPQNFKVGPIHFPPAKTFKQGPITTYGYEKEVLFTREVEIPSQTTHPIEGAAEIEYLVCEKTCVPALFQAVFKIPVAASAVASNESPLFHAGFKNPDTSEASLIWMCLLALLGGLLLNLMPCVFPVLSIKALQLNQAHRLQKTLAYTLGILVSFWVMAALLYSLQAGGEKLGWGFQLQSPLFVFALAGLFILMSLSLMGGFEFGGRFQNFGHRWATGTGYSKEFLSGVLTVVVATPCTAPFMGPALGYALAQSPPQLFAVMTFLGLGLASPFLILGIIPKSRAWLPRPGPWMETFKQMMSFPLLLSAVWLLWVFSQLTDDAVAFKSLALWVVVSGVVFFFNRRPQLPKQILAIGLSFVLIIGFMWHYRGEFLLTSPNASVSEDIKWNKFTPELWAKSSETPQFFNFTAAWCISCKVNELTTFQPQETQDFVKKFNIDMIKVDWTKKDGEITRILKANGRAGVPFYVLRWKGKTLVFPEVLTAALFIEKSKEFLEQSQ